MDKTGYGMGFARACKIAREEGLDALLEEQRKRALWKTDIRLTTREMEKFAKMVQLECMKSMRIASIGALHDGFGFGKARIMRYLDQIDKFAEYLEKGWCYWEDVVNEIRTRLQIEDEDVKDLDGFDAKYYRPSPEDFYRETDFIDPGVWQATLKMLGFKERKEGADTIIEDPDGVSVEKYTDNYDKVRVFDFLTGMAYGRQYYARNAGGNGQGEHE